VTFALLAGVTVLAGCSTSSTEAAHANTVQPTDTAAASAPSVSVEPTAAPEIVDPAAALNGALDALGTTYHFTTTASVDGATLVVADGDRVGDGTRLEISQGDASVSYVILPAGTWVKPGDGEWEQVETTATSDPIDALRTPKSVSVPPDGAGDVLVVSVPGVALGIPGDDLVDVQVTLSGNAIVSLGYVTTIDGRSAEVRAVLGPAIDTNPVSPPI